MTNQEKLNHARDAVIAWQKCAGHVQALFPEEMDTFDELMPPVIKRCIGLISEITGMP